MAEASSSVPTTTVRRRLTPARAKVLAFRRLRYGYTDAPDTLHATVTCPVEGCGARVSRRIELIGSERTSAAVTVRLHTALTEHLLVKHR